MVGAVSAAPVPASHPAAWQGPHVLQNGHQEHEMDGDSDSGSEGDGNAGMTGEDDDGEFTDGEEGNGQQSSGATGAYAMLNVQALTALHDGNGMVETIAEEDDEMQF